MKVLPFVLLSLAMFFCGAIRDSFRSTPPPAPSPAAVERAPEPLPGNSNTDTLEAPNANGPGHAVSGGILNDKAKSLPQPAYPAAARAVKAAGVVNVQVTVGEDGKVVSATAVSGHPLLRAAAVAAAKKAEFEPVLLSKRPVSVSGVITYSFEP